MTVRRAPGELPPARVQVWHCERRPPVPSAGSERGAGAPAHDARRVASRRRPSVARLAERSVRAGSSRTTDGALVVAIGPGAVRARSTCRAAPCRDVYLVDLVDRQAQQDSDEVAVRRDAEPERQATRCISRTVSGGRSISRRTRARISPARSSSTFVNIEDDHPVPERRAYGVAGFTNGEKSAILYDRFDLWQVNLDGSNAVRLTRGREDSTVYRCVERGRRRRRRWTRRTRWRRASRDAVLARRRGRTIDTSKPLILTATGEYNKKSGYAKVTRRPAGAASRLGRQAGHRSAQGDRTPTSTSCKQQTFDESPNYFVAGADARRREAGVEHQRVPERLRVGQAGVDELHATSAATSCR